MDEIFDDLPKLNERNARRTSDATPAYNCIAFAAGDTDYWWEAEPHPPSTPSVKYYWPSAARQEGSLLAHIEAYQTEKYEVCEDGSLEAGYEKIAIYAKTEAWIEHAARQLSDGWWTSKIGPDKDIAHETAEGVTGTAYGRILCWMKRPRQPAAS